MKERLQSVRMGGCTHVSICEQWLCSSLYGRHLIPQPPPSHPPTAATPQLQQTQPALHDHLSGPGIVPPGRQVNPDCVFLALAALITVLAAPSKAPPNHMLKCPWEESRFHTHGAMTQAFLVKQVIRRQYVLHLGEKKHVSRIVSCL